jgi:hypothetical protein
VSTKSETNQKSKRELEPTELKLLLLTRCPAGTGKTLKQLRGKTRRLLKSIRRDLENLVAEGYLDVCTKKRSPSFRVSEKGREAAGLLFGAELELVRHAAEEAAMRVDQLARMVGRPQDQVEDEIDALIERGFLESEAILNGELPAVWPSVAGLEEVGYTWKQYRSKPIPHHWPTTFSLINVREQLAAEFKDGDWECARTRGLTHERHKGNLVGGVLNRGGKGKIGVEVQLNGSGLKQACKDIRKFSREHTEVRYYCDIEGRAVIEEAIRRTGVKNVTVLDVPGELIYRSHRTRIPFAKQMGQAA